MDNAAIEERRPTKEMETQDERNIEDQYSRKNYYEFIDERLKEQKKQRQKKKNHEE